MSPEIATILDQANSYEHTGEWAAAIQACEEVYRKSLVFRDETSLLQAIVRLGDYYREAGADEIAEEHLELALSIAEVNGDAAVAGRALNALGILRQSQGDMLRAEQTYLRARSFVVQTGNLRLLGGIEQNLGTLANIRGDLSEALARYKSGLLYLQQAGHRKGCASVFNNLGMLHVDLRELDAASAYFQQALELCEELSDVVTAGIVHLNRTEMFLARGEPDRARTSCDEAFEIFSRLDYHLGQGEALKFYGIIYRETGKPHLAEIHLRQAVEIAANNPLLEAEAQRELAFVLRAQGKNREALEALNRAHFLFTHLQATHDQADVNQKICNLEGDFLTLVRSWGESIEAKDRYTSGHCQRVADYACRIAEEVGIANREIT